MSKRVLMFGWEYPPKHLGGLGVACQGVVRGLMHHHADVTLVLPHSDGEADTSMRIISPTEEHLKTMRIPSMLLGYDTIETYHKRVTEKMTTKKDVELYGDDLGEAVYAFTEMSVAMTKNENPDVVHSHDWMTFAAGARAAAHHHVPFVAQVHATELDRTHFHPNEWIYGVEKRGLEQADRIITVSGYTKGILVAEYGIPAAKIDVVHNGINERVQTDVLTNRQEKHPMVLFVGRLTVQKGAFHFLEAARIVREHCPQAQFVIAGDGYLLPELVNRACSMGLADNIIFAGKVNGGEVRDLYKKASCFVMPSTSEPFGLVALEAIAHHVPTILSKQSGVREVVPDSFHVDFWDIDMLADCICTVLREEPLSRHMRTQALGTLRNLTWENQAGKILSVYNRASIIA